ncbi:hypothetical protein U8527_11125 [Kordia algicida OT-1]|uniref:Uncharacterized protein n=1 Tax=Kordia algicida OT-1 TaxID=391587 RepID=A9EC18_9FLAO|nr:hypothetical protein [Kordia algicida]EDP94425.1 hypothetical protein KAOT1_04620 [Kordia algicida OT-1]
MVVVQLEVSLYVKKWITREQVNLPVNQKKKQDLNAQKSAKAFVAHV